MSVMASITTSVDGFVTGPDDRPGCGLGIGGERLCTTGSWAGPGRTPPDTTNNGHGPRRQGVLRRHDRRPRRRRVRPRHVRGGRRVGWHEPLRWPDVRADASHGGRARFVDGLRFVLADDLATAVSIVRGGGRRVTSRSPAAPDLIPSGPRRRVRRRTGGVHGAGHPRCRQSAVRRLRAATSTSRYAASTRRSTPPTCATPSSADRIGPASCGL